MEQADSIERGEQRPPVAYCSRGKHCRLVRPTCSHPLCPIRQVRGPSATVLRIPARDRGP
jgi:hypothetical protein